MDFGIAVLYMDAILENPRCEGLVRMVHMQIWHVRFVFIVQQWNIQVLGRTIVEARSETIW